jgi:phage terminase large subunit-like protein
MSNPKARSRSSSSKRDRSGPSSSWASFTHRTDLYARGVCGDTAVRPLVQTAIDRWWVAGPWVRLACARHLRDREAGRWTWSADAADLWMGFYEKVLRLPDALDEDGNPKPFRLEPPLAFIIGSLFGWLGPDGYRRFREAYIEMGKGNAKTPLLAGMGLGGLVIDGEAAPEIYAAAVTRDQAKIMHRDAERIVAASPELRDLVTKTVNNLAYGLGFFRPFSRDQGLKSGPRPHMALIDEVHEHPSGEVINKLKAGFKFRKQPLAIEITNSGFDRTSICWQHRQHAENILRGGLVDDRLFAYVCSLDERDDFLNDPACRIKANPMLGVTITHEYLNRQVENAKNIPTEMNTVLRLNGCVWTQQHTRAIDMLLWQACQPFPAESELIGVPCFGGLDLGQSDDFTAWVIIWALPDGRVAVKSRFFIPESALEKYPHRPYDVWRRANLLEVTEGTTTDYDIVEQAIEADCRLYGVREVAYDKRFAEMIAQHLLAVGVTMIDQPQGEWLNEAIVRKLELIASGDLCHGHNEILTWMASNYVLRHRGERVRPDKEKAGEKIDGQVALDMALARVVVQPVEQAPSDPVLVMW